MNEWKLLNHLTVFFLSFHSLLFIDYGRIISMKMEILSISIRFRYRIRSNSPKQCRQNSFVSIKIVYIFHTTGVTVTTGPVEEDNFFFFCRCNWYISVQIILNEILGQILGPENETAGFREKFPQWQLSKNRKQIHKWREDK